MKISLSIKQRHELETAHRAERESHYSDRLKAILFLDRGMNYEEVGDLLLCNNRSVRRYEERYLTGGIDALLSDERGGSNGRLNNQQIEDLRGELKGKAYQSSKTVRAIIEVKFGVSYALSSVRELLSRMGFVYKKPKVVPSKGDYKEQIEFANKIEEIQEDLGEFDKLYYVDGVHPQYSTTVTYGWIEKGTDVELPAQTGRKRVNLNGALDADSHEIIVSEHETLDAHAFIALMERLEAINEMSEVIYIVLDNARYYKNIDVKTYVETSRIQLLFLPPYSPNLNLIERVWKFLKQKLLYNKYFETFDQFRNEIKEFLKSANIKFTNELDSLLEPNFHFYKPLAT